MHDTPPKSPADTKKALRVSFHARREAIAPDLRRATNEALFRQLTTWSVFEEAESILTYVSTPSEADTHQVIERALKLGKRIGAPRIVRQRELDWHELRSLADLNPGSHGLLEPDSDSPAFAQPRAADLVLVPGLAFTPNGHRLGQGGGYFDRFLPDFTGIKVGLAYDQQIAPEMVAEIHDIPLDFIVTPTQTIECVRARKF